MLVQFPETRTGPAGSQCTWLRNYCITCGKRFEDVRLKSGALEPVMECTFCNTRRARCTKVKSKNEDSCRVHQRGRTLGVYTLLAGGQSDISFEDILERDNKDLVEEFALARMAIMEMLARDPDQRPPAEMMLTHIKTFFEIAEKRKKLEDGDIISVRFDDEAAAQVRKQVRATIKAFADAINEAGLSPSVQAQIIASARDKLHRMGNERNTVVSGLHSQNETTDIAMQVADAASEVLSQTIHPPRSLLSSPKPTEEPQL